MRSRLTKTKASHADVKRVLVRPRSHTFAKQRFTGLEWVTYSPPRSLAVLNPISFSLYGRQDEEVDFDFDYVDFGRIPFYRCDRCRGYQRYRLRSDSPHRLKITLYRISEGKITFKFRKNRRNRVELSCSRRVVSGYGRAEHASNFSSGLHGCKRECQHNGDFTRKQ